MKKNSIFLVALLALWSCNTPKESSPEGQAAGRDDSALTETPSTASALPENAAESPSGATDANTSATARHNRLSFNGTIVIPPHSQATVSLTMGGVIRNTYLLPGQYVQKNAVLTTLENPEFIELQQAWLESKAQTEYLEAEYERQKTLAEEQAASQKKLQQSKADYLSMKSRLDASEARLSLLGITASNLLKNGIQPLLQVKAPISGYLTHVNMNTGKYINPGDPLCEIIDKGQTLLCLTTYEKDLGEMTLNTPVEFRVNGMGDQTFSATIISIGQRVDATSRSLEVYARVNDAHQHFRPGMYVTARLKK